jgi:hypothetical protein
MSEQPPHNPFLGGAPTTTKPESLDPQSVQQAMAEAQNRPLDFDPATRSRFIEDSVRDIQAALAAEKTEAEIRAEFPQFIGAYPELFRKIMAREDLSNLKTMLAMMGQMAAGSLSHHQASMIVGTRLAERYLPAEFKPSRQTGRQAGRR